MARPDAALVAGVEAARAYVHAKRAYNDADANTRLPETLALHASWHDLLLAIDEPCDCEEGTCPGRIVG